MKKLLSLSVSLIIVATLGAQSLEEIVRKYTIANKLDKMSGIQTVKITGKMLMMGMEIPMEMWMKKPNKIKSVSSINGQQMVQVFDGEKGYTVNPMTGSTVPVEMDETTTKQLLRSSIFNNYLENYLRQGSLSLDGEELVNGKSAYRVKAVIEGGSVIYMLIDKSTNLLAKTIIEIKQGGVPVTLESVPSDFMETNGVLLPMKTTTSAQGMEFVTNFTKVEVDIPIEDAIFRLK
jgi:hypothetical protein